jgi:hypothetical protein
MALRDVTGLFFVFCADMLAGKEQDVFFQPLKLLSERFT